MLASFRVQRLFELHPVLCGVRTLLRRLIPAGMLARLRAHRRRRMQQRNADRSIEEVFTEIYETNQWGGARGEFCSGTGTADEGAVTPYIEMVTALADSEGFRGRAFVDLGCGDFRVGRRLLPLCSRYTGVDVVKPLMEAHQREHGNATTAFVHMDMVRDPLPDGDVCFLRQVLQHLSNGEIATILQKLAKYRWVFITEHYPADNDAIEPNKDKVHGGDVRVFDNSGVYLSEPPFSLPAEHLRLVLEVPGVGIGGGDEGVIRTFLYTPGGGQSAFPA